MRFHVSSVAILPANIHIVQSALDDTAHQRCAANRECSLAHGFTRTDTRFAYETVHERLACSPVKFLLPDNRCQLGSGSVPSEWREVNGEQGL